MANDSLPPGITLSSEQQALLVKMAQAEARYRSSSASAANDSEFIFVTVNQVPYGWLRHPEFDQDEEVRPADLITMAQQSLIVYTTGQRPPSGLVYLTELGNRVGQQLNMAD